MSKTVRTWRGVIWIAAAATILVGLMIVLEIASPGASKVLVQDLGRQTRMLDQLGDLDRPPTFGPGEDRDAWPFYLRARVPDGPTAGVAPRADDPAAETTAIAIGFLVEGARSKRVGRPAVWRPHTRPEPFGVGAISLGDAVIAHARDAIREHDPRRAAALATSALRFARDLAATGLWIDHLCGLRIADRAYEILGLLATSTDTPDETIDELATFVAAVDASWPTTADGYRREVTAMGYVVLELVAGERQLAEAGLTRLSLWSYAFSTEAFAADWWRVTEARLTSLEGLEAAPWPDVTIALRNPPFARLGTPVDHVVLPLAGAVASARATRARARLVTAALRFRVDGTIPDLRDPFTGAPLRHVLDDGKATIWSVGRNAIDDGGAGSLDPDRNELDLAIDAAR